MPSSEQWRVSKMYVLLSVSCMEALSQKGQGDRVGRKTLPSQAKVQKGPFLKITLSTAWTQVLGLLHQG